MDIRLGYKLLRDNRVPIRAKLTALGIGAACIAVLEVLELPLEAVLAAILPLVGITGDIALGGAEAVIGPVLIATMLLPYMVKFQQRYVKSHRRSLQRRAICLAI
jgi:hypothetical protein